MNDFDLYEFYFNVYCFSILNAKFDIFNFFHYEIFNLILFFSLK